MATIISAERLTLVDKTVRDFVKSFLKPIESSATATAFSREQFLSVYHRDVHWYDHAFLIHRQGHEAVIGLQVAFRHCNDPFDCEIKVDHPWLRHDTKCTDTLGHHSNRERGGIGAGVGWEMQQ